MDELGIDFTVLYPTFGLTEPPRIEEEEVPRAACRALNAFHSDIYRDYSDRMTPVAVIPVHTPEEGIEELEYAVRKQGFKAAVMSHVQRPVPQMLAEHPEVAANGTYLDLLALNSEYNYDPLWAKCVEVAVTPHATGQGWGSRRSISNYMFNHIGHFGAAGKHGVSMSGAQQSRASWSGRTFKAAETVSRYPPYLAGANSVALSTLSCLPSHYWKT